MKRTHEAGARQSELPGVLLFERRRLIRAWDLTEMRRPDPPRPAARFPSEPVDGKTASRCSLGLWREREMQKTKQTNQLSTFEWRIKSRIYYSNLKSSHFNFIEIFKRRQTYISDVAATPPLNSHTDHWDALSKHAEQK